MNALNAGSIATPYAARPLVVDMGRGWYGWVQSGLGFVLDTRGLARWVPLTDVEEFGGHVLKAPAIGALVLAYGAPVLL